MNIPKLSHPFSDPYLAYISAIAIQNTFLCASNRSIIKPIQCLKTESLRKKCSVWEMIHYMIRNTSDRMMELKPCVYQQYHAR
ncbi:hypothetical protein GDO86_002203 [Hymenochirus boettgeri]|uniref:Uncharacterized protein n=1 Tax=Hymenochirus boettgeri TaxID=247094 RepID=A0A8T2KK09_9PIPI|nr:hypothetical protein GDO86_002203 [Hymenochirus boettgeri]